MKIGDRGIALIQEFEGCKLTSYLDSVGVCTVGWGSTGEDVTPGLTITQEEADNRLRKHLDGVERQISRLVTVPLTQGEFDALCSFCYNLGAGALERSTLLKKLNASDYNGAVAEFQKWDKAGGKSLLGLKRRRLAEAKRFEEMT